MQNCSDRKGMILFLLPISLHGNIPSSSFVSVILYKEDKIIIWKLSLICLPQPNHFTKLLTEFRKIDNFKKGW